uniref:Alkylated DNA repair protein AlkB homologue 8 N-terminal domain-containing protein n=1 Tax=Micrurus paraensis TaxID=1970185 RepID=A0A2D4KJI5_9SAUR
MARKARQRLHFFRVLQKNKVGQRLMTSFYRSTIKSVLTYCITVWYAGLTAADRKTLQRGVSTAQNIVGCSLIPLDDIARARCLRRVRKILRDDSHPGQHFFTLLPLGRRYRSIASHTNRLKNSFYPWAVRLLNGK